MRIAVSQLHRIIKEEVQKVASAEDEVLDCPLCGGTGEDEEEECFLCDGGGTVTKDEYDAYAGK